MAVLVDPVGRLVGHRELALDLVVDDPDALPLEKGVQVVEDRRHPGHAVIAGYAVINKLILAETTVELTVNRKPTLDGARKVLLKTLRDETRLRNLA